MSAAGFEGAVRSLFSSFDRDAMLFAFDLWDYAHVKENAAMILARLETGEMPCDQPWPEEKIAAFREWVAGGCIA